jgi:hypothetical protein
MMRELTIVFVLQLNRKLGMNILIADLQTEQSGLIISIIMSLDDQKLHLLLPVDGQKRRQNQYKKNQKLKQRLSLEVD